MTTARAPTPLVISRDVVPKAARQPVYSLERIGKIAGVALTIVLRSATPRPAS